MPDLLLLPFVAASSAALLIWAMVKHLEMANEQRAHAAYRPRGRPYAASLPDQLIRR